MAGRKPDYRISALSKKNEHKGSVGCAWINEDQTITISLNSFVVLDERDDILITMFPTDKGWTAEYFRNKCAKKQTKVKIQRDHSDPEQSEQV